MLFLGTGELSLPFWGQGRLLSCTCTKRPTFFAYIAGKEIGGKWMGEGREGKGRMRSFLCIMASGREG
jgi:hypothetical protein